MKTLKKSLLILFATLTLAALFCFGASALDETGQCGDNVYWDYNSSTGELVISGTGAMYDDVIFYRSYIKSVVIKSGVTTIGKYTFQENYRLTSVTIPDSVTTIGDCAFYGCDSLTSVTIPDSVTTIGAYAFSCCGLTSVTIPDSVTTIENGVFSHCDSLTSVTIPDSVTAIGNRAFSGGGLTSVTIPVSVTTIGAAAFDTCPLEDVFYTGTQTQWDDITFVSGCSWTPYVIIHYNYCGPIHKNIIDVPKQNPTCTKVGYTAGKQCSHCEEWISGHEEIPATGHTYTTVITKATLTANGKTESKCSVCGDVESSRTISKIGSLTLSTTKYIHNGKNKTPKVTVKDSVGKVLTKNVDYKLVVASKRAGIGRYTVKVTFMGKYSGTKNLYFYVLPGKPATVKSASQSTSAIKLSWSAVPGAVGYTVYRYSPSRKAYVKAGTTAGTSITVSKLLSGANYTFRVVAYGKTASGKVYNSESYALLKTATCTATPELTKVTASATKGKAYVYHTDVKGETGYTVYYSTSKTTGFKKYANFKADTTRCDITKLTSGKTYYFKVRTYIKTDSGYVYSDWSNIKGVKVK